MKTVAEVKRLAKYIIITSFFMGVSATLLVLLLLEQLGYRF